MLNGEFHGDLTSHGPPEHVDLVDVEMVKECSHIIHICLTIHIAGVFCLTRTSVLEYYHFISVRETWYQGMEEIDVSSESCEKDDRFTFSRHFVMDPCSVNISEGHVLWIFT